jgi:hypothetical protein
MIPIMLFAKPYLLRRKHLRLQKAVLRTPPVNDNMHENTVAILSDDQMVIRLFFITVKEDIKQPRRKLQQAVQIRSAKAAVWYP